MLIHGAQGKRSGDLFPGSELRLGPDAVCCMPYAGHEGTPFAVASAAHGPGCVSYVHQ